MKINLTALMNSSKDALEGKWGLAIGTFFIFTLFSACVQFVSQDYPAISLITMVLSGPIALGLARFGLHISRDEDPRFEQSLSGFYNFSTAFITYILQLVIIALWTLLLIIPGIIAAIGYSMTFFILADEPEIAPLDALKKSKELMDGHKWTYFYLMLCYLGLVLLCLLTLGIGFFWLMPYIQVTNAKFYDAVKNNIQ